MLKLIASTLTLALLTSNTAFAEPVYAAPSCETGCTLVDHLSRTPQVIYEGTEERTYRICAGDSWIVHVGLDGKGLDMNPQLQATRLCLNFKGKSISVSGTAGSALVGLVGP